MIPILRMRKLRPRDSEARNAHSSAFVPNCHEKPVNEDLAEWKQGLGQGCTVMQRSEEHIGLGQGQWNGQKKRNVISEGSF